MSNRKAIQVLSDYLKRSVELDEYEHAKEQLLSAGLIKKSTGRGGSIEITSRDQAVSLKSTNNMATESMLKQENEKERIDNLMTSLVYLPGARAKQNKKTITLLCGDDNDKLFCGWESAKNSYYIQYRVEPGRVDHTDLAQRLFTEVTSDIPFADVVKNRRFSSVMVYVGDNVAICNKTIKRLMSRLEDETLENSPQASSEPPKLRNDMYYLEIGKLIKFCVDNNLSWPLKNWRKSLGFDDIDDLIVIGSSPQGLAALSPYREHIVPVSLIKEEALKMAERGEQADEISEFIRHHLYVVIITTEEARLLDGSPDAGGMSIKTTMPEGWIFGDDPTERLKAAGIDIRYNNHTLPKWEPRKPRKRELIRKIFFGNQ